MASCRLCGYWAAEPQTEDGLCSTCREAVEGVKLGYGGAPRRSDLLFEAQQSLRWALACIDLLGEAWGPEVRPEVLRTMIRAIAEAC